MTNIRSSATCFLRLDGCAKCVDTQDMDVTDTAYFEAEVAKKLRAQFGAAPTESGTRSKFKKLHALPLQWDLPLGGSSK